MGWPSVVVCCDPAGRQPLRPTWSGGTLRSLSASWMMRRCGMRAATKPPPYFVRDVDSFIEQPASYKRGSSSLYIDSPARGDVHIDVWSDSRQTDGFVYQKVLEAAQSIKSRRSR